MSWKSLSAEIFQNLHRFTVLSRLKDKTFVLEKPLREAEKILPVKTIAGKNFAKFVLI